MKYMPSIKKRGLDSGMANTAIMLGTLVIVLGVIATTLATVQTSQLSYTYPDDTATVTTDYDNIGNGVGVNTTFTTSAMHAASTALLELTCVTNDTVTSTQVRTSEGVSISNLTATGTSCNVTLAATYLTEGSTELILNYMNGANLTGGVNITNAVLHYNYVNPVHSTSYNISAKGLEGMKTFADFIPVLVVIAILGIIISTFGA